MLGPGLRVVDATGESIWITPKAPKGRKTRSVAIDDTTPITIEVDAGQSTRWEVARDSTGLHPTQKPVELGRLAITNSSKSGEIVVDPFLGSGSTLIGAEVSHRRCFGMELDPAYCDVIIERWQQITGDRARRS